VRARASGQYTKDLLPTANALLWEVPTSGAFDAGVVSADRGIVGSLELAVLSKIKKKFENSDLYVFTDGAKVSILDRGICAGATYGLASAAWAHG
jgi:hemolysin activation/secretion protein